MSLTAEVYGEGGGGDHWRSCVNIVQKFALRDTTIGEYERIERKGWKWL